MSERYITADLPGIGGTIKNDVADFVVEELPLYTATGEGQHTFFEVRKTGISTFHAVRKIAQALSVPQRSIGYAGLKDAQAITCQMLSVEGVSPQSVMALDLPGIQVLWAERHRNKLKIGHLQGNRFTIRVRGPAQSALPDCQAILDVLAERGVPNRFGPQRFGQRGDSGRLGRFIVKKDVQGLLDHWLGEPHENESRPVFAARQAFDRGDWQEAKDLLPGNMTEERRVLTTLIRTGGDYAQAYRSMTKRLKVFLVSAYQSVLFNRVLDERLQTLDHVYEGDVAVKHPGSSVFPVIDEAAEQPRAERFDISPTGPIFGYKMMEASGRQGSLERSVLESEDLTLEDFRVGGGIKARGQRRSLRFPVHEPELWYDQGVMLRFWLPKGCYATTLLAEIIKTPLPEGQDVS